MILERETITAPCVILRDPNIKGAKGVHFYAVKKCMSPDFVQLVPYDDTDKKQTLSIIDLANMLVSGSATFDPEVFEYTKEDLHYSKYNREGDEHNQI